MELNLLQYGQAFLTGIEALCNDPIDWISSFLFSNFHLICLAFAIYSAINSIFKLINTPSICSSSLDPAVFIARRRLFALHGFNLAIRHGFCTLWLLSRQIYQINAMKYGSSLDVYDYLLKIDYLSLMTTPLEIAILGNSISFQAMAANNLFQGIILLDLLSIMFDGGFSSDYWTTVIESSRRPMIIKDVPLSMAYPYANMISRIAAFFIDNVIYGTNAYFAMKLGILKTPIIDRIPADCDKSLLYFAILYLLIGAFMRIVQKGSSIGRLLLGIDVIKGDGSPLGLITALEREFYSFGFSCFFISPLVVLYNEEGGSIVDLISNTREIDVTRLCDGTLSIDGEDTEVSFPDYDGRKYYVPAPLSRPSSNSTAVERPTSAKTPTKTPSKSKVVKTKTTARTNTPIENKKSPASLNDNTSGSNSSERRATPVTSNKKPAKATKTPKRKADALDPASKSSRKSARK